MDIALKVFFAILQTFTIFAIGAYAAHRQMLTRANLPALSRLGMDVFFPFLTFSTVTRSFTRDQLGELWLIPTLALLMVLAGYLLGFAGKRLIHGKSPARTATVHHLCTINNYIFLPLIVINSLRGERHVAILLLMNLGFTIGFWTLGLLSLSSHGIRQSLKNIFSVNLLALAIAVLFTLFNLHTPFFLTGAADMLGGMSVPFLLLLTGAALYFGIGDLHRNAGDILRVSALRLIFIPAALILLFRWLPIAADIKEVCLIISLMPAASSSALIAQRYGGEADFTAQVIIVTTLLSIFTIPLWISLIF